MPNVFILQDGNKADTMKPVEATSEVADLQDLLDANPDLLPGDQISPNDPCRWLPVKREMEVESPESGQDRWSLDFFFVDHTAMPTFVECKLGKNRESRRMIIGQMLEYAANAQHYWDKEKILKCFSNNPDLENTIKKLVGDSSDGLGLDDEDIVDSFFELVVSNLKEGILRLVFFLDEAPRELKSIVQFLNNQTEKTEFLVVEARKYAAANTRIVVPTLFGFTEQAHEVRQQKRSVRVSSERRIWNETKFLADIEEKLEDKSLQDIVRGLYFDAKEAGYEIGWASGKKGGFNLTFKEICSDSFLAAYSNGKLRIYPAYLLDSEQSKPFIKELINTLHDKVGLERVCESQVHLEFNEWKSKADALRKVLRELYQRHKPPVL